MVCQLSRVDIRGNLDEVIDAIKVWLSQPKNMRWPMIYDNYDNPKLPRNTDLTAIDIGKFLLEPYQGSVIITTRPSQVKIGYLIRIRKLENVRHLSLKILSNAPRREGLIHGKNILHLQLQLQL